MEIEEQVYIYRRKGSVSYILPMATTLFPITSFITQKSGCTPIRIFPLQIIRTEERQLPFLLYLQMNQPLVSTKSDIQQHLKGSF